MNKQPYELVLNFSDNPVGTGKEGKIRRSRHGCFNCRKRKKKCDELRPTCSSCLHKCIKCIWPTGNEKVPANYKIPPVDPELLEQKSRQKPLEMVEYSAPQKPRPQSPLRFDDTAIHSSSSTSTPSSTESHRNKNHTPGNEVQVYQDEFMLNNQNFMVSEMVAVEQRQRPLDFIFDQSLFSDQILQPSQRDKFMSAAVNGFITSLGPQYTHPSLTTSATFTPLIQQNTFLIKIAEACGASFLSWTNQDLTELSSQKYAGAMDSLFEYVNRNGYGHEDETWLAYAFQLLVLCAKVTWGGNNKISIRNMMMCYEIITRRISRFGQFVTNSSIENYQLMPKVLGPNSITDKYVTDNNSLKMEVENSFGGYLEDINMTPFMRQSQRMLVESFIYNYSICILVTPGSEGLPNPFEVFRDMRRYLKTPLFTCDVEWMNNPVLGASFDAYELAAKASYLIRHPEEPWIIECAQKLLQIAENQPPPLLPTEVRHDPLKFSSLRDSILLSEIVMKATKIVLMKTLNPMLDARDPLVQREVRSTVFKLKQIPPASPVRVISSWALFVIGLACVDEDTRAEIINCCLIIGELVHGRFVYTIMDVLEVSWGQVSKLGTVGHSRGLDVLLDLDLLSKVFI